MLPLSIVAKVRQLERLTNCVDSVVHRRLELASSMLEDGRGVLLRAASAFACASCMRLVVRLERTQASAVTECPNKLAAHTPLNAVLTVNRLTSRVPKRVLLPRRRCLISLFCSRRTLPSRLAFSSFLTSKCVFHLIPSFFPKPRV